MRFARLALLVALVPFSLAGAGAPAAAADTQPPVAQFNHGAITLLVQRPSEIRGSAFDDFALDRVEIRIAFPTAALPAGPTIGPARIVTIPVSGTFAIWKMVGEVGFGVWRLAVRAIDASGKTGAWSPDMTVVYPRAQ